MQVGENCGYVLPGKLGSKYKIFLNFFTFSSRLLAYIFFPPPLVALNSQFQSYPTNLTPIFLKSHVVVWPFVVLRRTMSPLFVTSGSLFLFFKLLHN